MNYCDRRFKDMTGYRFGMLVVEKYLKGVHIERSGRRVSKWRCRCDCGNFVDVFPGNLRSGDVASCGCLHRKVASDRFRKHGNSSGGPEPLPEYVVWKGIIARCTNKNNIAFHNYGGRGIKICDEWKNDFLSFLNHMGRRPSSEYSVDRIDNDGNYEPGNVKWSTRKEQRSNTRKVTKCKRGHEFTEENTYISRSGKRSCRTCNKERYRMAYIDRKLGNA